MKTGVVDSTRPFHVSDVFSREREETAQDSGTLWMSRVVALRVELDAKYRAIQILRAPALGMGMQEVESLLATCCANPSSFVRRSDNRIHDLADTPAVFKVGGNRRPVRDRPKEVAK
jgi:hypothetical protein